MEKKNLEKESNKNEIALFKYAIIAPLVNDIYDSKSKEEFYRTAASKQYKLPNGKTTTISAGSIKRWYLDYKKDGFEALKPKSRNDAGYSRKIPNEYIKKIEEIKEKYPHITGKAIYRKLLEDGIINAVDVSISSLYRFLNNNKLHEHNQIERKAFEMEFANDCWQGDTSHGPIITIDGKKVQTYLIQLIDDASRLIVGYKFFLRDNALNFQIVLKDAIKTYGIPKRIFVDNGTPYKNMQLKSICASMGIALIHAKPYSPESKAKIERSFRTVKDNFINCKDWNAVKSLEELNKEYNEYIASEYNSKYHSGIENIPRNRFQKDYDRIKFIDSKEEVEKFFLHIEEKPVAADSTIRLGGKDFEVPQKYIKQRILIKYAPEDLSKAYIYNAKTKELEEIRPVDKIVNSKIKRKNISYN